MLLTGMVPLLLESRSLGNDNHGDSEEERDEVHDGIDIGRVHILGLVSLEGLGDRSSKLALEGSGKIGERGISEGSDVDVDALALLDAGKADTANDGNEHGISEHGLDIYGRYKETDDGSKDRLAGLDDLRKANGSHSHGKDRSGVGNAGHEADGDAGSDVGGGKIGLLAKAGGPHHDRPDHTDNELSGSDEPMSMDHVGSLLVVHIVHGIAGIPGNYKKHLWSKVCTVRCVCQHKLGVRKRATRTLLQKCVCQLHIQIVDTCVGMLCWKFFGGIQTILANDADEKSKCINADSARVAKHIIYLVGLNRASRDHEIWRRNYSPASWERNQTWRRRRPSLLLLLGAMREWRIQNQSTAGYGWHGDAMASGRHREDPVADAWNAGNAKPLKHEDPVGRRKTALYRITVFTLFCLHVHVHCRVYIM